MKNHIISTQVFAIIFFLFASCGKDILDKSPQDRFSDAVVWADIDLADAFLKDCYRSVGNGMAASQTSGGTYMIFNALADFTHMTHGGVPAYFQRLSAGSPGPFFNASIRFEHWDWVKLYAAIHKLNTFIANVDLVKESYTGIEREAVSERSARMKGEGLFLRAFAYHQLARLFGGVPLLTKPFSVGDDYLSIVRASFEETVNFISSECDAASALLGTKAEMEMGRATMEAALALKSRILLFAASDLTADGSAASRYVGYENPDRQALWTAAKNAALAVINLGTYSLADFGAPDQEAVASNYYDFFRQYDLSNQEIIWGKLFHAVDGTRHQMNKWHGPNGLNGWGSMAPTQNLVDMYQMANGSDFWDHFDLDGNNLYKNASTLYSHESPYYNREPRFYGSILYDSAAWQPRYANLADQDPLGIISKRTRRVINNGVVVSERYGLDTRSGPIEAWNGSYTGYLMKKMLDHTIHTRDGFNRNVWIEFRYAEILLNYAEACLELGETGESTTYINMIRNRAGLPDFTGDITEALRYERNIEFAFEQKRFYDIKRWKILDEALTPAMGMDIIETNTDGVVTTTWRRIQVEHREYKPALYWAPIATAELERAPQLVQNPGY
jgi:starch-binding outer membrane protein, SusD/RagB family